MTLSIFSSVPRFTKVLLLTGVLSVGWGGAAKADELLRTQVLMRERPTEQTLVGQATVAQDVLAQDILAQDVVAQQLLADLPNNSRALEAQTALTEPLRSHVHQGKQLLRARKYAAAIAKYDQALELQAEIPEAWYGRMLAQKALGQSKEAVFSYYAYAEASRIVGDLDTALAGFEWFLARRPDFFEAALGKSITLEQMGNPAAALRSFAMTIEIDPQDPRGWEYQGDLMARLEDYERAAQSYEQWVALAPESPEALWSHGHVLIQLNRYEAALERYVRLAQLQPEEAEPQQRQGWILLQLGRFREAVVRYDAAIAFDPSKAANWQGKGYALAQLNQYDTALENLTQAVKLNPQDAWSWQLRAEMLEQLGRREEAKESLRQVDILREVQVLSRSEDGRSLA